MRTPNILRTQAYRIVIIFLAIFAVSAIALGGFVYGKTALVLEMQTNAIVDARIAGLVEQYQTGGLDRLTDVIVNRLTMDRPGLYLLADKDKHPVAGNLDAWPAAQPARNDFVEFTYERKVDDGSRSQRARGKIFRLPQGYLLLVARDEKRERDALFASMLLWSAGLIVLGVAGSAAIRRRAGRGYMIRAHA